MSGGERPAHRRALFGVGLFLAVASGCALGPPSRESAPQESAPAAEGVVRVPEQTARPVLILLNQARGAIDAGDLERAGAHLERALRIEPRNAVLWHYLGRLRLRQGLPEQAVQLAVKSNALAGNHRRLRADNLRLIAFVRERQGDRAAAQTALTEAERLEREPPPRSSPWDLP